MKKNLPAPTSGEDQEARFRAVCQGAALFQGVAERDLQAMLACLGAVRRDYGRDQTVLEPGQTTASLGLVLEGSVLMIQEDFWGNRNILGQAGPGELFAEAYACAPHTPLALRVVTEAPSSLLFLEASRVLTTCSSACPFHNRIIRNLLATMAEQNLGLQAKLTHVSQRSTREKLLSYLSAEAQRQGGPEIRVPFNRQQLADYLSVERSAMCAELSRMRDQGLLDYDRDRFLLRPLLDQGEGQKIPPTPRPAGGNLLY